VVMDEAQVEVQAEAEAEAEAETETETEAAMDRAVVALKPQTAASLQHSRSCWA
jgi:hypothetical protein